MLLSGLTLDMLPSVCMCIQVLFLFCVASSHGALCVFCCAEAIRGVDVTYFVGPVDVPDTTYYVGYTMTQLNTTRICETYVSDECVAKRGAEACVKDQVRLLAHGCIVIMWCSRCVCCTVLLICVYAASGWHVAVCAAFAVALSMVAAGTQLDSAMPCVQTALPRRGLLRHALAETLVA